MISQFALKQDTPVSHVPWQQVRHCLLQCQAIGADVATVNLYNVTARTTRLLILHNTVKTHKQIPQLSAYKSWHRLVWADISIIALKI